MIPTDGVFGDKLRQVVVCKPFGVNQWVAVMESGNCFEINLGNGYGHIDSFVDTQTGQIL